MKISFSALILCLFLIAKWGTAQTNFPQKSAQDSLGKLSFSIWKQKTESDRIAISNTFFNAFRAALDNKETSILPFDSLPGITRSVSSDGLVRIFTWNVPLSDGTNKYWGLIQKLRDSSSVISLDHTDTDPLGLSIAITPQTWYGALYYKIIDVEFEGKTVYTLLAWDGFNKESNRKLIDILSFDNLGNAKFGMPVFKTDKGIKTRIVFEYADKANMLLRYDFQAINVKKRKKIKKEANWMIVMDRLVPMDPSMQGVRKYYVPAGDTYDGYIFRNGFWILVEEIEVANTN